MVTTSHQKDFYYQIAKGGQGEVKQKMTFKEIK